MGIQKKKETRVEIYGRNYTILGDASEEYTMQLASYVDKKMEEIVHQTSTISTLNLAILVALNIADELFQLRDQIKSNDNLLEEKLIDVLTKLENLPHP
jgi:cell division protein ZapA